ncbi:hypothetical protein [Aquimarina sp. MMG016]|uniref:hypothetical protein n=1 Tax=Aquimarina sp. MMG016 TaxID=2822690 RepID=UPI001B3A04B4|nr:hypothetical protein [Aquimarina sp. MMG016]MBQ4820655.1 hypothetical protein [Aquimarina sp. MMG016]
MMKQKILQIKILLILFLGIQFTIKAQDLEVKEVLSKTEEFYENQESYDVSVTYNMFRGLTGTNITESYQGSFAKDKDKYLMKVLGSEILQFNKGKLIINHKEKTIRYEKGASDNVSMTSLFNIDEFLTYYDKTKAQTKGNAIVCELVSTKKNFQLPYGKVVLYLNKSDYSITKQVLYFSSLIPFAEDNKQVQDYGRLELEMTYQNQQKSTFSWEEYINISSDNKATLQEKYKAYALLHQSNQQ